jgi:lipopolysaccharide transport system permease protein
MDANAQESIFSHEHVTVIEPSRSWRILDWRELWAYRELLWVLSTRDVRVRYKQSVLGASWAVLRPVLTMVIFTLVFGRLAKMPSDGLPYAVFVYAGLLPWMFFASAITASAGSLVGSAHLVSKVYFPRLIIPLSSLGSALVDLAVSALVLLALMLWFGVAWSASLVAVPLLIVGIAITAVGVGTLLSALTVSYRDFVHITPFLVQIWMFATPVVYPASLVPPHWQWLLQLNPLTGLVEGFRAAFLGRPLDAASIAFSFAISIAVLVLAVFYFERAERRFADVI